MSPRGADGARRHGHPWAHELLDVFDPDLHAADATMPVLLIQFDADPHAWRGDVAAFGTNDVTVRTLPGRPDDDGALARVLELAADWVEEQFQWRLRAHDIRETLWRKPPPDQGTGDWLDP